MTKRKNTKRALFASMISMLLCVAMLIGSTFAWFTDNATTAVNSIQAGTLDIELLNGSTADADSLEGTTLTFAKSANAPEGEAILFEPGAQYALQQVWLHNAGNLHAKYQVVISGIDGNAVLAQVLDVIVDNENCGTLANLVANGGIVKNGTIAPGEYQTFGTIDLKMQESAGNEYQGKSLEGIAISVLATQAPVEYDSYENTYDENAVDQVVFITSQDELEAAISDTGADMTQIVLSAGSYNMPATIGNAQTTKNIVFTGPKEAVIDMTQPVNATGCTITFDGVTLIYSNNAPYSGLQHSVKEVYRNCTIQGTMTLYAAEAEFANCNLNIGSNIDSYCVWTYGAKNVTFTGCTFNTSGKAVLVYIEGETHANVTLNSCTFNDDNTLNTTKGAVEIGHSPYSTNTTYNIYMNDCSVNGFAVNNEGISTGSTFWGNKNSMDTNHLNVVIDGVDVY